MFAEARTIFSGSANTLANLPGLVSKRASAIAKGYASEIFHAFSTGAPSPNFQFLFEFINLIISSFWDQKQALKISVSRKEVLDYYNKNKESFYRETEEVFLEHYFTEELVFSKKLRSYFILNKKTDINISDFLLESKTVKKGRVFDKFSPYLFDNQNNISGPIKSNKGYHFFKILNRYEKGSLQGLEIVYDEIFQRLYEKKKKNFSLLILDSLKNTEEIYINPKYQ